MSAEAKIPPTLFTGEPSQHLKCPVCQKLYQDPVINITCGHTFCRKCVKTISQCPIDGNQCVPTQLVVNRLVVGQLDDLQIYCQYGVIEENGNLVPDPSGCQQKLHVGSRRSHEDHCEFAPIPCPNLNSTCGKFRKSELDEHLKVCVFTSCRHQIKGCEFQGSHEETKCHEGTCGYRGLQRTSEQFAERTQVLEAANRGLTDQMSSLIKRVGELETSNSNLHLELTKVTGSFKELQQKYDILTATVDQLVAQRNSHRKSPRQLAEWKTPTSRGTHRDSSSTCRPYPSGGAVEVRYEKWAMPFQFKCIGTLRGHQGVVWSMCTKNKKLFSAGGDSVIKVWDLETLSRGCIKTIQGHTGEIHAITVEGDVLFTGGADNTIQLWSVQDFTNLNCIKNAHDNTISSMVIVGGNLFSSSFSLIKVWDAKTLKLKHTMSGLHHWVRTLALNPERDKLYSGSHNTVDIWDVNEPFSLKGKVDHQFGSVYSLAITTKYIIAGTIKHGIQVFDVKSYQYIQELRMHIDTIHCLVTPPSGRFLFSASGDKCIQIWNLENMLPTQSLQRHDGSVNTLLLYGDFLFSGSEDKEIKVFVYDQI